MQKSLNRPCSGWNFTICGAGPKEIRAQVILPNCPSPPKNTVEKLRISQNRVREILESAGMSQKSLPSNVVSSAQVLANVANLLNIQDTELRRYTACGANI